VTARPEIRGKAAEWLTGLAGSPRFKEIALSRLSRESVSALVAAIAENRALPAGLAERIVERADGVPLFIEEITNAVLRTLAAPGSPDGGGRGGPWGEIPLKLQDLLTARLDQLG